MELTGTIVRILDEQQGIGKNGQWRKKEFVVQQDGPYPRLACFVLWNNKIDQFNLTLHKRVKVSFDVESREYNNKYYTDLIVWRVEEIHSSEEYPLPEHAEPFDFNTLDTQAHDDLPF